MPPTRTQNGPLENLNGVMDRFQAWTATQPAGSRSQSPAEGVREVTYQEALAAERLRRPTRSGIPRHIGHDLPLDVTHDLATLLTPRKPVAPPPASSIGVSAPKAFFTAGTTAIDSPVQNLAVASKIPSAKREARPKATGKIVAQAAQEVAAIPATVRSTRPRTTKAAQPGRKATRVEAPGVRTVSAKPESRTAIRRPAAKAAVQAALPASPASTSRTTGRPDFRAELMKSLRENGVRLEGASKSGKGGFQMRPVQDAKTPVTGASAINKPGKTLALSPKAKPADSTLANDAMQRSAAVLRSISINLRLSHTEHSQLRSRAADAHQPMAVYVRECALRPALPVIEHSPAMRVNSLPTPPASIREPEPAVIPSRGLGEIAVDLFIRFRTFWLGRRIEVTA